MLCREEGGREDVLQIRCHGKGCMLTFAELLKSKNFLLWEGTLTRAQQLGNHNFGQMEGT